MARARLNALAKTIFFNADTHLSYDPIIRFCDRPFSNAGEMDETLVTNWSRRVGPEDTVFHLGGFCWRKSKGQELHARLRGHKHLFVEGE